MAGRRAKRQSCILIMLYCFLLAATLASGCGGGGGGSAPGTDSVGDTSAPGQPTGLVAAAVSSYQIDLSWDASADSDIASYMVFRGTTLITTVSQPTTTASDSGLNPLSDYCYTVQAVDGSGNASLASAPSCTTTLTDLDIQKPAIPGSLSITVTSPTSVLLSWSASTDNFSVAGYRLYKDGAYLRSITSGTSSTDGELTANRSYCYTVSAYDAAANESDKTAPACATPEQPAPSWITATPGDGQNTISWTETSFTGSYNLYFSTSAPVTKLNGTALTMVESPYVHTGLTNGTTYYYVITAVGTGGESGESPQASAAPAAVQISTGRLSDTGQVLSYTATAGEDSDYLISAPSYTDNHDGTITDKVTGLVWQKQDDVANRTWYDANTYCSENAAGLPGMGWRLPTRMELQTIIDYSIYSPAINATYFPNTAGFNDYYWSSSYDTAWPSSAKTVSFHHGSTGYENKVVAHPVRCVRGQALTTAGYSDNGNGTVTDNVTGLMWQQSDDAVTRSWLNALSYCEDLSLASYADWRLPNVKELSSLITDGRYEKAIDPLFTYAKTLNNEYYWASTTAASFTSQAWRVSFNYGTTTYNSKSYLYYTRCVRGK